MVLIIGSVSFGRCLLGLARSHRVCTRIAQSLKRYAVMERRTAMPRVTRRHLLAVTGIAALAGCSSGSGGNSPQPTEPLELPTAAEQLPLPTTADALADEARSGGPGKDGIPSIDEPTFIDAGDADFLDPGDPVFGVVHD